MSRPLRIELAAGLYHVTSRGDRREAIYSDDQEHTDWLGVLGEVCSRFNWRCHAWCQMTNHYHIVVETPETNLSKVMRQLNGVYTQASNHRHGLVGHLFQGRFKAILVERDAYLVELARYVVLNPVRAAMVAQAGDWPWSSYRAMVGAEPAPVWLEIDWVLGQFGEKRVQAQAGYAAFVGQGIGQPGVWDGLRHQVFLRSERFVEQHCGAATPERLREVPRAQRRPLAKPLADFMHRYPDRGEAMARAFQTGVFSSFSVARVASRTNSGSVPRARRINAFSLERNNRGTCAVIIPDLYRNTLCPIVSRTSSHVRGHSAY
ncbi:transposase [Candidatus Thiodictyon syntrophicum]|jgi:REP element-mobilizing transposase RayT|uniref:Addiction module toxin RelE n=1 Tax=Candidatus Thiodictyon syntrophicum TaxID=1166950 RepID=A0A2K8UGX6_9GAMM|nr:transposase [Candidatus Thiodictyon syntrophicum]AUB84798.1 addiction module toxin RelE [Candidatus Thiodictyon syntrophicum]